MKNLMIACSLMLAAAAFAQDAAPAADGYRAFGEKPGLVRLMDDFMIRLMADPRTAPHFREANQKRLKEQLVDQFCQVLGGPCAYKGADMKSAHGDMEIRKSDFNALVEVLQQAMDAQGISFGEQNRLLAKLAPMHRDVITAR